MMAMAYDALPPIILLQQGGPAVAGIAGASPIAAEAMGGGSCPDLAVTFPAGVIQRPLAPRNPREYRQSLRGLPAQAAGSLDVPASLRARVGAIRIEPDPALGHVLVVELTGEGSTVRLAANAPGRLVLAVSGPSCLAAGAAPAPTSLPAHVAGTRPVDPARVRDLADRAEEAMRTKDDAAAAPLVAELLSYQPNEFTPRARELAGILAERAGRRDEARAIFEAYLADYPGNEGVPRVEMRLGALEDAGTGEIASPAQAGAAAPAAPAAPAERRWRADLRGSFSQYYLRDRSAASYEEVTNTFDPTFVDHRVNVDEILTQADVTLTLTDGVTIIEARAAAGHDSDYRPVQLTGSDRNTGSYDLLDRLYLSATNTRGSYRIAAGRQVEYGMGIFGRFDGISGMLRPSRAFGLRAAWGHPVWSERQTSINQAQEFYALAADFYSKDERLTGTLYWFDQRAAGEVDRQAIGAQVRVRGESWSLDAMLDYDVSFDALNAAWLNATKVTKGGTSYSLTAQLQHYPALALTDAVIGQLDPRLESVLGMIGVERTREIAQDRSLVAKSVTATINTPLSGQWQLTADVGLSSLSGDPGSLGIPAYLETGTEWQLGAQLVGNSVLRERDTVIAGARFADLDKSRIYMADLGYRLPLTDKAYVSPRLRLAYRDQKDDPGSTTYFAPSLRLVWQVAKGAEIDAQVGANIVRQSYYNYDWEGKRTEKSFIAHLGYILRF